MCLQIWIHGRVYLFLHVTKWKIVVIWNFWCLWFVCWLAFFSLCFYLLLPSSAANKCRNCYRGTKNYINHVWDWVALLIQYSRIVCVPYSSSSFPCFSLATVLWPCSVTHWQNSNFSEYRLNVVRKRYETTMMISNLFSVSIFTFSI